MIGELMGWDYLFSAMPYDEKWRRRRRLFQRFFPASRASALLQPQERTYVRRLLPQLIDPKKDYRETLRQYVIHSKITAVFLSI